MEHKNELRPEEVNPYSERESGVRFTERVDELDAHIEQDLHSFLQHEKTSPELANIATEGRELAARTRRAVSERMEAWKKNPLFKPLMVAAALHALPAVPAIVEHMRSETEGWNEGFVIRPQSEVTKQAVSERVAEREARIDKNERDRTKQGYREKMERGERVSFKDLYFRMERVNGVDPGLVEEGEQKADQLIEKYAAEAQAGLDEPLIKRMVNELYGPEKAYEWGQASVSEYFVKGSRNCVAVAKGELIVFEGVVLRLPEDVQKRYGMGLRKVEQHQFATLAVDGQTYLLETPLTLEPREADRAGTADIGLDILKKGIVSEKPIFVQAVKGDNINSGPRIDVITNQPVDDGIVVEGKLRASGYVEHVAKEQKVVPKKMDEMRETETRFVEVGSDERVSVRTSPELYALDREDKAKPATTVDDVQRIKQEKLESTEGQLSETQSYFLSTSELVSPSLEAVKELAGLDPDKTVLQINKNAGTWNLVAVQQLFKLPYTRVQVGSVSGSVLELLKTEALGDTHKTLWMDVGSLTSQDLQAILKNIPGSPGVLTLNISPQGPLREEQLQAISRSGGQKEVSLTAYTAFADGLIGDNFKGFSELEIEALRASKPKLLMTGVALLELFQKDVSLIRQTNIGYSNLAVLDREEVQTLRDLVLRNAPERKDLIEPLTRILEAAG